MPDIVLIEDDAPMRELMTEWLTQAGYSVHAPTEEAPTPVDVVIVDLFMPRQAGADLVRAVQERYRDAPVIAISCQFVPGLPCAGSAARALGARRAIAKPCSREGLLAAVREVIASAR